MSLLSRLKFLSADEKFAVFLCSSIESWKRIGLAFSLQSIRSSCDRCCCSVPSFFSRLRSWRSPRAIILSKSGGQSSSSSVSSSSTFRVRKSSRKLKREGELRYTRHGSWWAEASRAYNASTQSDRCFVKSSVTTVEQVLTQFHEFAGSTCLLCQPCYMIVQTALVPAPAPAPMCPPSAQCPVPSAQWQVPRAQCPVSSTHHSLISGQTHCQFVHSMCGMHYSANNPWQ